MLESNVGWPHKFLFGKIQMKTKSITITPNHKAGVTDWKSKMTTRAGQIRTRPQWDATSKTVYEGEKQPLL